MTARGVQPTVAGSSDDGGVVVPSTVRHSSQRIWFSNYLVVVPLLLFILIGLVDTTNANSCPEECCKNWNNTICVGMCRSPCGSMPTYERQLWQTIVSALATVLMIGLIVMCCCGLYISNFGRALKLKWINRHQDALRTTQDNTTGNNGRPGEDQSNRMGRSRRRHRDAESADVPPPPNEIFPNDSSIFRPPDYDDLSITSSEPPKYEEWAMTSLSPTPATSNVGTTNPTFEPEPEDESTSPIIHVIPLHMDLEDDSIPSTSRSQFVVGDHVTRPEVVDEFSSSPPTYDNAVMTSSSP